jgi:crossover junction endonuclease MUS81
VALRKLRPELAHLEQHPFKHDEIEDSTPKAIESAPEPTRAPKPAPRTSNESQAGPSRPNKFHFWYIGMSPVSHPYRHDSILTTVDSSGNRVEELSAAMIRLDHDEFINLRKIEFLASQKSHPFATQLRLVDKTPQLREDGEPSLFGYVVEEGAPPTCSKFPSRNNDDLGLSPIRSVAVPESGQTLKRPREIMPPSSDGFDGIDDLEEPASKTRSVIAKSTFARTASVPSGPTTSAKLAADAAMRRLGGGDPLSRTTSGTDLLTKARAGPRLSSHIPAANPLKEIDEAPSESANIPDFDPRQSIVFPAGSYDVVLVLDTREIESKSTRDNFSEAIQAKGINIETRALRLGDVLWVAKRRDGLGGEEDECVLDYVVERKRLDDLCSSIKDGRYTEQCVSLRARGL